MLTTGLLHCPTSVPYVLLNIYPFLIVSTDNAVQSAWGKEGLVHAWTHVPTIDDAIIHLEMCIPPNL